MKRVLEQMTWPVISISEGCTVGAARKKLGAYDIDRLPIVDISGNLIGIVSTTDVANANQSERISDYQTRDVISISPFALIEEAIELLHEHDVGGLPVTIDNLIVGVLTWADIECDQFDDCDLLPYRKLAAG